MSGVTSFCLKMSEVQGGSAEVEADAIQDASGRPSVRLSMRADDGWAVRYFTPEQLIVLAGNLMALANTAKR